MQRINYNWNPRLAPQVAATPALGREPFSLIDVGCSGGINPLWRLFEPNLIVNGFEPQFAECARLQEAERSPRIRYHAKLVGVPPGHPFLAARGLERPAGSYFDTFSRSSYRRPRRPPRLAEPFIPTIGWRTEALSTERVGIDEFVQERRLENLDFLKVDTDGADLEVLHSAEATLKHRVVLGVLSEFCFSAHPDRTSNCFSNLDHFMREQGFLLYDIEIYRYSRAALPARFLMAVESATISGQVFQGDALYLRDGSSADFRDVVGASLTLSKKLKLLCLYEMFGLPDCAAELISTFRRELDGVIDTKHALNQLTPSLDGLPADYETYCDAFDTHRERFLPAGE